MDKVISKDGTAIAYDRSGNGPPIILVCGASTDRMSNAGLAALLAPHLTVFNYDRRGRGDSGDKPPYAVQREIEDIDALVKQAGGSAFLYGTSSGAALALEAAAGGLPITQLALWEPPYFVDDGSPRPPADQVARYNEFMSAGRRGDAVEYFMSKVVGLPPEFVSSARSQPWWAGQEALAHTLAYDATIMGDHSLPVQRAASVSVPTLVMVGGESPAWMRHSTQALAQALPHGQLRVLEGQRHDAGPQALASAMIKFFAA